MLEIEEKQDSPEKIASTTGKPTKYFLFAWEFNAIITFINNLFNAVNNKGLQETTDVNSETSNTITVSGEDNLGNHIETRLGKRYFAINKTSNSNADSVDLLAEVDADSSWNLKFKFLKYVSGISTTIRIGVSNISGSKELNFEHPNKPSGTYTYAMLDDVPPALPGNDNKTYGIKNGVWSEVVSSGGQIPSIAAAVVNSGYNGVITLGTFVHSITGTPTNYNTQPMGVACTNIVSAGTGTGSYSNTIYSNYFQFNSRNKFVVSTYFGIGNTALMTSSRSFCGIVNAGFGLANINFGPACNIGVYNDTADANLQIKYVNTSGMSIVSDLGSNFPARYTVGQHLYRVTFERKDTYRWSFKIYDIVTGNSYTTEFTDVQVFGNCYFGTALNSNTDATAVRLLFNHVQTYDTYGL